MINSMTGAGTPPPPSVLQVPTQADTHANVLSSMMASSVLPKAQAERLANAFGTVAEQSVSPDDTSSRKTDTAPRTGSHTAWFEAQTLQAERRLAQAEDSTLDHAVELMRVIAEAKEDIADLGSQDKVEQMLNLVADKVSRFLLGTAQEKVAERFFQRIERTAPVVRQRLLSALERQGFSAESVGRVARGTERLGNITRGLGRVVNRLSQAELVAEAVSFPLELAERGGGSYIKHNHDVVEEALDNAVVGRIPVLGGLVKGIGSIGVALYDILAVNLGGSESDQQAVRRLMSKVGQTTDRLDFTLKNLDRLEQNSARIIGEEQRRQHDDIQMAQQGETLLRNNPTRFSGRSKTEVIDALRQSGYKPEVADQIGAWVYRLANATSPEVIAERNAYRQRTYVPETEFRSGEEGYVPVAGVSTLDRPDVAQTDELRRQMGLTTTGGRVRRDAPVRRQDDTVRTATRGGGFLIT